MKNDSAIVGSILKALQARVQSLAESGEDDQAQALADQVERFQKVMADMATKTAQLISHNTELRERAKVYEKRERETNVITDCCARIDRLDIEGQMRVSAYLALRYNPRGFARLINSRHEAPATPAAEAE